MQEFTSDIQFICPVCGGENRQSVPVPELNFAADKTSEMSVNDIAEVACTECETVFTGTVFVDVGSTHFEFEEPVEFQLHGDMPFYGPEDDDYIPTDPRRVATDALETLEKMIGQLPAPEGDPQFANRLVFAGAVTALEAYLSDTLLKAVRDHDKILKAVATQNKVIKNMKLTFEQLASRDDYLKHAVLATLSEVIYHNLKAVRALYMDALSIEAFPDDDKKEKLFKAVQLRHDCVHRNGFDKAGNQRTEFTDEFVKETIRHIAGLIDHIETEIFESGVLAPAELVGEGPF